MLSLIIIIDHYDNRLHSQARNRELKKERNETNSLLYQTIEKYDKNIETLKQNFDKEITELKKREEEYLHSNANLLESDIFTVYKEIQEKFEHKLKENVSLKGQNDKMCI